MLKKQFSTNFGIAYHPNAGQNIQHTDTQTEKNRQHKSWAEEQTDAHTNRKQFKNCKEVPLSFFATKNKISFSNEAIYL